MAARKPRKKADSKPRKRRAFGELKLVFDIENVEKMAKLGMTNGEIADLLGIHRDTFQKHLKDNQGMKIALDRGKGHLSMSLRRELVRKALMPGPFEQGQTTALLFALKNYCGMQDKPSAKDISDAVYNLFYCPEERRPSVH